VESDSWQLRYPVGPDAATVLGRRAAITDEQWTASAALPDEEWAERIEKSLGIKIEF
jgi:hypothetical protein